MDRTEIDIRPDRGLTSNVRRSWFRYLLPALVIAAIATAILWRLSEAPPWWYRPPDAADPRIAQVADDFEYRVVEEVHKPRDERFTIRLREEHANAWLAARLPRWIAGRDLEWPSALGTPQVRLKAGGLELAGDIDTALGRRFVIAHIRPRMEDDRLILDLARLSLGRLSMSGASAEGLLSMLGPEKAAELERSEAGAMLLEAIQGGAAIDPEVRLSDGRTVRLADFRIERGLLDLTFVPAGE